MQGLTLLECLIALGILAILVTLAIPLGRDELAQARAEAAIHQLHAAVAVARNTALAQGRRMTLCPSIDGQQCGQDWSKGYLLVTGINPAQPSLQPSVLRVFSSLKPQERLVFSGFSSDLYLHFDPLGSTWQQNGTFVYCPEWNKTRHARALVVSTNGRARVVNAVPQTLLSRCE